MSTLPRFPLRVKFNLESRNGVDSISNVATSAIWRGNDVSIDIAVFSLGAPLDLSNLASLTLQIKDKQNPTSDPLAEVEVLAAAITAVITEAGYNAGTEQNATFDFTSAQTNQTLNDAASRSFWLVLSGLTSDGKVITYGAVTLVINEDNAGTDVNPPPTPPSSYYDTGETDALLALKQPLDADLTAFATSPDVANVLAHGAVADGATDVRAAFLLAKATGRTVYFPGVSGTVYYFASLSSGDFSSCTITAAPGVTLSFPVAAYQYVYQATFDKNVRFLLRTLDENRFDKITGTDERIPRLPLIQNKDAAAIDCTVAASAYGLEVVWNTGDTFSTKAASATTASTFSITPTASRFGGMFTPLAVGQRASAFVSAGSTVPVGVLIRGSLGWVNVWADPAGSGAVQVTRKLTSVSATNYEVNPPGFGSYNTFKSNKSYWSVHRLTPTTVAVSMNGRVIVRAIPAIGTITDAGFVGYNNNALIITDPVLETRNDIEGMPHIGEVRIFGDSTASPYAASFDQRLTELLDGYYGTRLLSVTNYAIPGQTSTNTKSTLTSTGVGSATFVVLVVGTNDIQGLASVSTYKTNLSDMIDLVVAGGAIPIVVQPWFFYSQALGGGTGQNTSNYDAGAPYRIAAMRISSEKGARFVETTAELPIPEPTYKNGVRQFLRDNIHQDWIGYRLYAESIARAIASEWHKTAAALGFDPSNFYQASSAISLRAGGTNQQAKLQPSGTGTSTLGLYPYEFVFDSRTSSQWSIQAVEQGVAFKDLYLNPSGGTVRLPAATAASSIGATGHAVGTQTNDVYVTRTGGNGGSDTIQSGANFTLNGPSNGAALQLGATGGTVDVWTFSGSWGKRGTFSASGFSVPGNLTVAGTVIHTLSATPASASATGTVGTIAWDANYIYICVAANTWKRVAIATW